MKSMSLRLCLALSLAVFTASIANAATVPAGFTPPTVSITSPVNGATVARKATITIAATASDNVGVTRVDFLVNGSLQCSDTTAPFSCNWKVPGAMNKTHQLQARAFDQAGNSAATVQVTAR